MNGKAQLQELFQRYKNNQCSEEEFLQLLESLTAEDEETKKEVWQLFENTWNELKVYPGQFNLPEVKLPEEKQEEQSEINGANVIPLRRPWIKYVAAAAVLVMVAVGAWWFKTQNKPGPEVAVTPKQQDLPPGREGAILTLADGREVVLDSTRGNIATDGGATIVNTDGNLVYKKGQAGAPEVVYNLMTTPRGRTYSLVLSDGTRVWLNASSSIRYPTAFTGSTRSVQVIGEAYFEVAHDASRPFKVGMLKSIVTGRATLGQNGYNPGEEVGEVEVLGTHFNINAYPDEDALKVTLLEGSVKLSAPTAQQLSNSIVLKPGEQGQLQTSNYKLQTINDVDIDAVVAWKNGWFEFDNIDIGTIMRQVSRWYDVDIVYQGKVSQEKFGGRITRNLPLSDVLELLESNGVQFKLEGNKLIVR